MPILGVFSPIVANQVSVKGLEPLTNGLKGHCSTIELHARNCEKYSITRGQLVQVLTFLIALVTIQGSTSEVEEFAMADISKSNEATFESEVLKSTLPVMVEFTAVWCGPCKMLDPLITQLSQDWDGKVKVVKLDVDGK